MSNRHEKQAAKAKARKAAEAAKHELKKKDKAKKATKQGYRPAPSHQPHQSTSVSADTGVFYCSVLEAGSHPVTLC